MSFPDEEAAFDFGGTGFIQSPTEPSPRTIFWPSSPVLKSGDLSTTADDAVAREPASSNADFSEKELAEGRAIFEHRTPVGKSVRRDGAPADVEPFGNLAIRGDYRRCCSTAKSPSALVPLSPELRQLPRPFESPVTVTAPFSRLRLEESASTAGPVNQTSISGPETSKQSFATKHRFVSSLKATSRTRQSHGYSGRTRDARAEVKTTKAVAQPHTFSSASPPSTPPSLAFAGRRGPEIAMVSPGATPPSRISPSPARLKHQRLRRARYRSNRLTQHARFNTESALNNNPTQS